MKLTYWRSGWGWAGRLCTVPCRGWRQPGPGHALSGRPMDCLGATNGAGLCLQPLVDSRQLLLLCHYRVARGPPLAGSRCSGSGAWAFWAGFKRVELRQIAVDTTAWYWHAMGLAWSSCWLCWPSVNKWQLYARWQCYTADSACLLEANRPRIVRQRWAKVGTSGQSK